MNRRKLLQATGLAILSLLPIKLLRAAPKAPEKYYLGYNEPYDRSLVRFRQTDLLVSSVYRAELFYENVPGQPPVMLTVNHGLDDREMMHHVLQLNIEYKRKNPNLDSGMLHYHPDTDQLLPYRPTVAA